MPATVDTLRSYIAYLGMSGLRPSTIRRKRVAIGLAHAHAGLPRPDLDARVRELEHGLAKTKGSREVGACAGSFRSNEIVALERKHITFTETGATVFVARSKENQLGRGKNAHICFGARPETCPQANGARRQPVAGYADHSYL